MRANPKSSAQKKPLSLGIDTDLLNRAEKLGINLSAVLEQALAEDVRQKHRQCWLAENKAVIEVYNAHVETHGVFSEGQWGF